MNLHGLVRRPATCGTGRVVALCALLVFGTASAEERNGEDLELDRVSAWVTEASGVQHLARQSLQAMKPGTPAERHIEVDPGTTFQQIDGFGAALTDASAFVMQYYQDRHQRRALLEDLFDPVEGIGLRMMRLTIGASDFSLSLYSFDDVAAGETDPQLEHFSMEPQAETVLPVAREILKLNPEMKVIISPWSAPAWMKSTDSLVTGRLRPDRYDVFAEYLSRAVQGYEQADIPVFAVTLQNEPHFEPDSYPGMRLNPQARRQLLGDHVGPLFAGRHPGVRLLEWDHNWVNPGSVLAVLDDPNARRFVGGIAWHCYVGYPWEQNRVHEFYPDLDAYMTECTGGGWEPKHVDPLTETAGGLLIESLRAWAKGIVLWNVVLDENAGPRIGGCPNCRPVVTVDSHTGEATRNPEYYALAHFSRFVRPGAVRVASSTVAGLDNVAFRNADDGSVVLVVVNPSRASLPFTAGRPECLFEATLPARSLATYVWSAGSQCRPSPGP